MKELFLNKELSLIAKEKGFDEPCFAFHDSDGFNWIQGSLEDGGIKNSSFGCHATAPLYQQIIDWLFKKLDIDDLSIKYYSDGSGHWSSGGFANSLTFNNLNQAVEIGLKLLNKTN